MSEPHDKPADPARASPAAPSGEAGVEWLRTDGREGDVVMSSRVRFARNLAGMPFVHRASRADRQRVLDRCREGIIAAGSVDAGARGAAAPADRDQMVWLDMARCSAADRTLLVERHLISKLLAKGRGGGVGGVGGVGAAGSEPRAVAFLRPSERISIMVNEEDHLRMQVVRAGLCLPETFELADRLDDALQETLDFAYSPRWGFLTACPTNVGTGVRMSVMLHLPALRMIGDIEKVKRAASDMNLAVRGFYGEGSEAAGDLYQVSNQTALGKSEEMILREIHDEVIPEFVSYERHARKTLLAKRQIALLDQVHRAWGLLKSARLISAEEAMQLLSHLRLGAVLGLVPGVDLAVVNHLLLLVQPAHLQRVVSRELDQDQRREARAQLLRAKLGC